jgi:hypothetical protein
MFRLRICLIIALVAGATPVATAADYTVPTGVTILTEEQLLTQVIGSTFMGGTRWVEYYEPPTDDLKKGRIKGNLRGYGLYNAIWTIKGAQMCWQYKKYTWPGPWGGCFTVALDGDTVARYKANGEVHAWRGHIKKLVPGNPENL